jgi:hypothetical protein
MFRPPHFSQRRNTTSSVNRPGCGTPIRSRTAARTGQDSGSGQKPVDGLLTSTTSTTSPSTRRNISPEDETGPPPVQATCSERRSARNRSPRASTTKVAAMRPSGPGRSAVRRTQARRSAVDEIFVPVGCPRPSPLRFPSRPCPPAPPSRQCQCLPAGQTGSPGPTGGEGGDGPGRDLRPTDGASPLGRSRLPWDGNRAVAWRRIN